MGFVRKLTVGLSNPGKIRPFLSDVAETAGYLARRGEFATMVGLATKGLFNRNLHTVYVAWRSKRRGIQSVVRSVDGAEMILRPADGGVSLDLLTRGRREDAATRRFCDTIRALRRSGTEVVVFDIGANIGYYSVLAANLSGEDSQIYAFEPERRNIELLQENVEHNAFGGRIQVESRAVGAEPGTAELRIASESNRHRIESETTAGASAETQTVSITTIDTYLDELDREPSAVDFVRIDVEGHEGAVIRGMESLLAEDTPLFVMIEIHAGSLSRSERAEIFDVLEASDIELVAAMNNFREFPVDSYSELLDREHAYQVFGRRRSTELDG